MNKRKIGGVIASVVLAAGLSAGLCGCGGDEVQEIMQEMPSGESTEQMSSGESGSGEESASAPSESEDGSVASLHAVDELDAWAQSYIEGGVAEKIGLPENLTKDAVLDYAVQDIQEDSALIRYYIEASDHSIYVVDETVKLSGENRDYVVTRESLQSYTAIESADMFAGLHGEAGINSRSTGYNAQYFRGLVRDMLADETLAERYANPVDAAVNLLHLGPGKGEVTGDIVEPEISPGSWMEDLDEDILLEGTTATVTYTFDKDGSVVEIPMEVIEASFGIWAPAEGNWSREIHKSYVFYEDFEDVEDGESKYIDSVQNSTFGIYELKDGGIRCVYPYYLAPDIDIARNGRGVIYFMADSLYQEGNLEYQVDCIAMLDLATGEVDMESMMLPSDIYFDQTDFIYLGNDGFLSIDSYYLPYVNVGAADFPGGVCWNGKPVAGLNEAEQNAYGSENRAKIVSEPGKVLLFSLSTMTETYAYIDLDGDGVTEKVVLKAKKPHSGLSYEKPYDDFILTVGDSTVKDYGENLHNDIYAFSPDGQEILLLLYEDGPSGDPVSKLYAYRSGELVKVGEMASHIKDGDVQNGYIHGEERGDVIQTDYIYVKWQINQEGKLEKVPQETYDYTTLNDIIMQRNLPVHSAPDLESEAYKISPQNVKFLKTDDTLSWVYVQGENGEAGWVYVNPIGYIAELDMYAEMDGVFKGLYIYD